MSIAVFAGIVLLVVVLVSLPRTPEPATVARVTVLPLSGVHLSSLSVDDGIAYASSPDGPVTAPRNDKLTRVPPQVPLSPNVLAHKAH